MKLYRVVFALIVISVAILTVGCSSTENKPSTAAQPAAVAPPQKKATCALYRTGSVRSHDGSGLEVGAGC